MSKYKAYLSPVAEFKLVKILNYIEEEFGINSKAKFLATFTKNVQKIESNPKSCPKTELEGIFKNVISKQTSFYYRIQNLDIEIITLTDNRQDPKKIAKELEKLSFRK
ncbi:MAG: hypothetical protein WD048_01095 [Chitinophagales bacterium]